MLMHILPVLPLNVFALEDELDIDEDPIWGLKRIKFTQAGSILQQTIQCRIGTFGLSLLPLKAGRRMLICTADNRTQLNPLDVQLYVAIPGQIAERERAREKETEGER